MRKLTRAVILGFVFFLLHGNSYAYIHESTAIRPKNHSFNKWMAELIDKEKEKLGGLALQIPTSLPLSQAKLESNNGKSLMARKWNNYFGLFGEKNKKRKVLKFHSPEESVRFYLKTLTEHKGYERFRKALRQGVDDPKVLIQKVAKTYAEDPNYQRKVVMIMRKDNLTIFD
jgi:uncharacterized FlgJ-related protein